MNETNRVLLGLLSRALFAQPFSFSAGEIDWQDLFKEAHAQTVHLLVYECLTKEERAAMPAELLLQWKRITLQQMLKNEQLLKEQATVLTALREEGISCAILKGSSNAINYPKPELRCSGDIDVLVSYENLKPAELALQNIGYRSHEKNPSYHIGMSRERWATELHFEPAKFPDGKMGDVLRAYFKNALDQVTEQNGIPVLAPCHEAVLLLLHKISHIISSGLGLRQICDWAQFVDKKMTTELWAELEPCLKRFGILRFTKIVTRLCVDHLGLLQENAEWCMDCDEKLAQELLEDILKTGNFGRKEERKGQHIFTDGGFGGRAASLFRFELKRTHENWPISKKYPILTVFMPIEVAVRYGKQLKNGWRPSISVTDLYRKSGQRQHLYEKMKLFLE